MNLSPKTIKSYRNMILVFLKCCDNVRGVASIEDINKMDIQFKDNYSDRDEVFIGFNKATSKILEFIREEIRVKSRII